MGEITNLSNLPDEVLELLETHLVGTLTEPVAATNGWIVFLIEERTRHPGQTFDEARAALTTELEDKARQQLFDDWFDEELRAASIEVDSFYGTWDTADGRVQA